jgi:hypothetical protein
MPVVSAIGPPPLNVAVAGRLADQPADHVAVRPNAFRCPLNCSVIDDKRLENWLTPGCDFTARGPRILRKRTVGRRHEDAEHIAPSLCLLAKLWCVQHVPIGFANGRTSRRKKMLGSNLPWFAATRSQTKRYVQRSAPVRRRGSPEDGGGGFRSLLGFMVSRAAPLTRLRSAACSSSTRRLMKSR